jgi:hypothetical protein
VSSAAPTAWTAPGFTPPVFHGATRGHADGANAGFLRPGSTLAIVLLSDSDDCSAEDVELFDPGSAIYGSTDLNLRCSTFLYYSVPIAAPFAAFLTERAVGRERCSPMVVDASVLALSLARAFLPVSGRPRALLRVRRAVEPPARAALLRAPRPRGVAVIKLFLWGDTTTLLGGLAVAAVAAWIRRGPRRPPDGSRGPGRTRATASRRARAEHLGPIPRGMCLRIALDRLGSPPCREPVSAGQQSPAMTVGRRVRSSVRGR